MDRVSQQLSSIWNQIIWIIWLRIIVIIRNYCYQVTFQALQLCKFVVRKREESVESRNIHNLLTISVRSRWGRRQTNRWRTTLQKTLSTFCYCHRQRSGFHTGYYPWELSKSSSKMINEYSKPIWCWLSKIPFRTARRNDMRERNCFDLERKVNEAQARVRGIDIISCITIYEHLIDPALSILISAWQQDIEWLNRSWTKIETCMIKEKTILMFYFIFFDLTRLVKFAHLRVIRKRLQKINVDTW